MKKITLFAFLMASALGFSQLRYGFEPAESGSVGGSFGNMAAPVVEDGTGTNTTKVLKIVGTGGVEVWQGVNLTLTTPVGLSTATTLTMTMDVLSSTPITFLVKVLNGAPTAAAEVTHNGNGLWQTLSFTFNSVKDGQAASAEGIFADFVIHAYWLAGETSFFPNVLTPARTFYVDNISGPLGVPPPSAQPATAAPTPPVRPVGDVLSLYSDFYTDRPIATYSTGWDDSSYTEVDLGAGDLAMNINFSNFLAFQFSGYEDGTAMTMFHMDYWIPNTVDLTGKVLNPKLSNHPLEAGEVNALLLTNLPVVKGSWVSLDVPLATFTPQGSIPSLNREKLREFILSSNMGTGIFVDNIYLHKNTLAVESFQSAGVNMYHNSVTGTLNIEAKGNIESVSIFNVLGQEVAVSAPNSTSAALSTSGLPSGVYVVKVSIDGKVSTSKFAKQ